MVFLAKNIHRGFSMKATMKEYDSLEITGLYTGDDGEPLSLENVTVFADIANYSGKVFNRMETTIYPLQKGVFSLKPTCDKIDEGLYKIDLLITNTLTGKRESSPSIALEVLKALTTPR